MKNMTHTISTELKRIELHDSHVIGAITQNDSITLIFDWAKITDYHEQGLGDLILGETKLVLNKVHESYLIIGENLNHKVHLPNLFIEGFKEILVVESQNDNDIKLGTLMNFKDKFQWVDWHMVFDNFQLSWHGHITHDSWLRGKLPPR